MKTNRTPVVSVVLPTYNRESSLSAAVRSVLEQSFCNLELIVVDDGSTDGTARLLAEINDERLRVLALPTRTGAPAARNRGIEIAEGRYVAFQDSDDIWGADRLASQVKALDEAEPDVAVVYGRTIRRGRGKELEMPRAQHRALDGDLSAYLAMDNFVPLPATLVRTELLRAVGAFDPTLPRFQDWDLWLKLADQFRFVFIDEVVLVSYETKGSISLDQGAYFDAIEVILARHREAFARVPGAALHHHFRLARKALLARRPRTFARQLRAVTRTAGYRSLLPVLRHNLALRSQTGWG